MMPRGWLVATALVAAGIVAPQADASPQEVIGFGYRSIAMGNTGVAAGQGVDAVYANPALLSLSREMALELGITSGVFHLVADGPQMPGELRYSPLQSNTIGGLLPLPFGGVLEDRITIGLGFQTPFDVVVRGRILYPEKPQFLLADRVQSVAVQAAVGADLGYGIRAGVGFAALAALSGSVLVATDSRGRIGTVVKDTLVASYAPIFGASYDLDHATRLGLVFRGELVGRFNVIIEAKDLGDITIPPLNISGVAQYDPWQIGLEAARSQGPWKAALALVYKHWPAYPGPPEATVRCEDAADEHVTCDPWLPPDPGYRPVVSPRVGVERAFSIRSGATLLLRTGYGFEPTPAPLQKGYTNTFDNSRSVISAGYGIALDDPLPPVDFNGFVQLQLLHPRTHPKRVAEGASFDGNVRTSGSVVAAGVAGMVRF